MEKLIRRDKPEFATIISDNGLITIEFDKPKDKKVYYKDFTSLTGFFEADYTATYLPEEDDYFIEITKPENGSNFVTGLSMRYKKLQEYIS